MGDIIRILDPDDARIAAYRDIRERDLVGRRGRFVAEGRVVLRALLESPHFEAESILVLENRIAGLEGELALKKPDTPVYVASRAIIDAIAGFPVHRGILAIGHAGEPRVGPFVPSAQAPCLVVVCAGISNHDNIGSIFRNAAAFGADAVLLDETCCDPLYRKALRVSVGAALNVPFFRLKTAPEIIETLIAQNFKVIALSPKAKVTIDEIDPAIRMAVVLGAEGPGLSSEILAATRPLRIAMAPGFDSLNVAAASAIALHRLSRNRI